MKAEPQAAGTCATCGRPLTQVGPKGECLRCLVGLGFLADGEEPERPAARGRLTPGPLRYAHFEVEVGDDGFPVELGAGAMAVTYRARDTVLNSEVALKVIDRSVAQNPGARSRFLREARAAANIHHPNVARVTYYGEQDGECFYAMELVKGETLEARVRRDGPMPLASALEVIEQAARALAAAEACGVVHRDIKPSNIMLQSDASGAITVKLIDYGVAKVMGPQEPGTEQTQAGFIGTPAFASPEQFVGGGQLPIDTRSDIYSLGVTFWYLLTGRTPFAGGTMEEIRVRQTGELPLEHVKALHLPGQVIALLKSMLAPDPKKRPQTARELLSAVHRCYARFNPEARASRKRAMLASAACVLTIIAMGTWLFQRTRSFAPVERSIAVLPFENLSEEKQNEYFADGVQDEILTDLAKIADLKVISRTSVLQYKSGVARNLREIGQQLGVANVVEGSVQRSGNRVRVNAQLVDARNDTHLWAQTYDRDLADVFAIQSEIAKAIAEQLQAKLSPNEKAAIEKPPTKDLTAYDLYLRGRALYADTTANIPAREKLPRAASLLEEAVARDPRFLLAWCLLSRVHGDMYFEGYDHTTSRNQLAKAAVQTALRLDPDAGEGHLALAEYYYHGSRSYEIARSELDIARHTLPNSAEVFEYTGYIDRRDGRWEEATQNLERAVELDPRNFLTLQQLAVTYSWQRRYLDQARALDRALIIVPGDPVTRVVRAGVALDWRADIEPFQKILALVIAEDPKVAPDVDDPFWALCERSASASARMLKHYPSEGEVTLGVSFPHAYWEGVVARSEGDLAKAHTAFTAARADVEKIAAKEPAFAPALSLLGMIDAGLGRKEEALREGRRACELLPPSKDAIDGVNLAANLAEIYAWTKEKDLAIDQITRVERVPNNLSYGLLKLHPYWDPLRGEPRFEKLVEEAKQPVAVKNGQ